MRVILAIIFLVFATKAITEEPIKAITSDGKEVLLNEQDMTWRFAGDKPNAMSKGLDIKVRIY